jgi:hypothetical protein
MLLTRHDLCLKIIFIFAFQKRIMWDEQITELKMLHKDEFHSSYPSATTRVGLIEMDHRYAHRILVNEAFAEIYMQDSNMEEIQGKLTFSFSISMRRDILTSRRYTRPGQSQSCNFSFQRKCLNFLIIFIYACFYPVNSLVTTFPFN